MAFHHIEIIPTKTGHIVRHFAVAGQPSAEHRFFNAADVADHVEDALSPAEANPEPPSTADEVRESNAVRESPDAAAARRRERHENSNPMGIGRKAPERKY